MDFKEQFRTAKAARDNSKQQVSSSQYAREDGMPPPPPRGTRHTATMHEDSQMTQLRPTGGSSDAPSVSGGIASIASHRRPGLEWTGDATRSLQDSCVPAGFFEEARPGSKKQKKTDTEYGVFMQEMSALGAVKENKDDTVAEVSVAHDDGRADGEEEHVSAHGVGQDESDTEEDFHQFVRRERMQEIKEAVQRRDIAALQDQQSVAAHVSDLVSEEGSNIRLHVNHSLTAQGQKSAAESHINSGQESPVSSEDDDDVDWRSKKLT